MEVVRKHWICKVCGGTDLLFDARAEWDRDKQTFVLTEVFPAEWTYCNSCEDIVDVKEVEDD